FLIFTEGKIIKMVVQSIYEGAIPIAMGGVYHHPSRFVDYQQILVFINYIEGDVFGQNFIVARRFCHGHGHYISRLHLITSFSDLIVYLNRPRFNTDLNLISGSILYMLPYKKIQAHQTLTLVSYNPVVLIQLVIFFL